MRLTHRIERLERTALQNCHLSPIEQFGRVLDEAAVRRTGKSAAELIGNDAALDLVLADLQESFMCKLNPVDRESLMADLETIAFKNAPRALEEWRRGEPHRFIEVNQ